MRGQAQTRDKGVLGSWKTSKNLCDAADLMERTSQLFYVEKGKLSKHSIYTDVSWTFPK